MDFVMAQESGKTAAKRLLRGVVISDKMEKTIIVKTVEVFKHTGLHKYLRREKKYKVHDADSLAMVGDTVEFYEGRPIAKTKFMYLNKVVSRAEGTAQGGEV